MTAERCDTEAKETQHRPPRRRTPRERGANWLPSEKAFEALNLGSAEQAVQAVRDFSEVVSNRLETLQAGKGGPLLPRWPQLAVDSTWICGHLDLSVDEQHGEVRRLGINLVVSFQPDSLAWEVFQAAWDGGEAGYTKERWLERDQALLDPVREKSIRRDVNRKLRVLGIRLEPRCPPRLVEQR